MKKKQTEFLGYLGMILVVSSFLLTPGTTSFLIANLSGAILSASYGFLIKSKPVWIMNVCIGIFDVLHLLGVELIQL